MRHALSRLLTLGLPALLLVAGLMVWSGGAQATEAMHHHDGAHAAPCHQQADQQALPGKAKTMDQGCCLFAGCAASVALPGMTGAPPATFTLAPPQAITPIRLVTQALTGPPAEPPRL